MGRPVGRIRPPYSHRFGPEEPPLLVDLIINILYPPEPQVMDLLTETRIQESKGLPDIGIGYGYAYT